MVKKITRKKSENEHKVVTVNAYENDYFYFLRQEHLRTYEVKYKPSAYDIYNTAENQEITDLIIFYIKEQIKAGYRYKSIIINTIEGGTTIAQKSQEYIHKVLYPFLLAQNIQNKLYCLGEEVISKLSITLTAETADSKKFNNQFFATHDACVHYIKNNL
ncbi:hypothetical protein DNU06_07615 [Putridiphycobacter roseus]|uniref:Uncharacterized protein n=1 Tax=Putridiphycobacter roseus TaxID=2219161 RepID=A0A2W1NSN1_9FLAO|nr:hypothetical protein [Putridiphycobacter roseus]PZE17688.1 hypothetical protein DNU06_07615 [Putridiphycobacter roseus]